MTRVLLFGFGALPIERLRVAGPSLRTWHFTRAILDAGHDVCLIGDRMAGIYPDDLPSRVSQTLDRLTYHSVDDTLWHNPRALRPLIADFRQSARLRLLHQRVVWLWPTAAICRCGVICMAALWPRRS